MKKLLFVLLAIVPLFFISCTPKVVVDGEVYKCVDIDNNIYKKANDYNEYKLTYTFKDNNLNFYMARSY